MDENHPLFNEYGGYSSIGTVFFDLIDKSNSGPNNFAKPSSPSNKNYPLINELISLIKSPTPTPNSQTYKDNWYYVSILNLWNHPHQNASPNPSLSNKAQYDFDFNSLKNKSQSTFVENPNIRPLLNFSGDIIYEGRFSNSIRLGSTSKSESKYKNNWSESGNNGDPLIIIRNGQSPLLKGDGFIPTTEDINNDLSSIYQTSYQKIPIKISCNKTDSFQSPPTKPDIFTQPQIILNSDRILINSKSDHIIASARKSIHLTSNISVNIDTPETIISSQRIKLGGNKASEPLVKGNQLHSKLDIILNSLITLVRVLEVSQVWPEGKPIPDGATSLISSNVKEQLIKVKTSLKDILSEQNKTL
jgi:hypothetical protein